MHLLRPITCEPSSITACPKSTAGIFSNHALKLDVGRISTVRALPKIKQLTTTADVTNAGAWQWGALPPLFSAVYDAAWFVGVAVSSVVYVALMRTRAAGEESEGIVTPPGSPPPDSPMIQSVPV